MRVISYLSLFNSHLPRNTSAAMFAITTRHQIASARTVTSQWLRIFVSFATSPSSDLVSAMIRGADVANPLVSGADSDFGVDLRCGARAFGD